MPTIKSKSCRRFRRRSDDAARDAKTARLPAARATQITAEVEERVGGHCEWFVYFDGDRCIRQGFEMTKDGCIAFVREHYGIEPRLTFSSARKKELAHLRIGP